MENPIITPETISAMEGMNKIICFSLNYPMGCYDIPLTSDKTVRMALPTFLYEVRWSCPISHMVSKWEEACSRGDAYSQLIRFYVELDRLNRKQLLSWIDDNYNSQWRLF